MMYRFRYFYGGRLEPALERHDCEHDAAATRQAAEGLLRLPSRDAVEVWNANRLVYHRRRRGTRPAGSVGNGSPAA
jgi:hypothetical protein